MQFALLQRNIRPIQPKLNMSSSVCLPFLLDIFLFGDNVDKHRCMLKTYIYPPLEGD